MDTSSDIGLVRRAQSGDANAFEDLVTRHYMTVYRTAYRWCGIREDAEDITQDVFVKVARKLRTFAGKSAFTTWLYRVTLNTARDFGRKRSTRRTHETAWTGEPGGDPSPSPEAALTARQVYRAIDRLPERQKAAALLVWAEGLTHREAARVLDCAESTVSGHIFQAKEKLRDLISRMP